MTPEATLFDIQKLMAAALVAFALGAAGNVITFYLLNRRDIRDLDRETKRLAFWKTMRELKADSSEKTGLSQMQINALDQRFKEEVQASVDVMMGWKRNAHTLASAIAWLVTMLFVTFTADALLPFLDLARRSGLRPGTAQYFGTEIGSMLGFWFALRAILYRPTYEMVQRKALRLMREPQGKFNVFMLVYK